MSAKRTEGKWEVEPYNTNKVESDFPIWGEKTSHNITAPSLVAYLDKDCYNKEANAEYICKAVNNYEEMRASISGLLTMLCSACYRLNPHHVTENQGKGCNSCSDIDPIKTLLKSIEEAE